MGVAANLKLFLMEREYKVHDKSGLDEMANLTKKRSGLDTIIYVSNKQGVSHGPRVKVSSNTSNNWTGETFTVTIENEPKVLGDTGKLKHDQIQDAVDWVKLNKDALLKLWNETDKEGNEYDMGDFYSEIKKL